MNVRLQEAQRHSWTISSFFLRVPRRVSEWPPQCGQASGCLAVSGTRALRGIAGILAGGPHPTIHLTKIEKAVGTAAARKMEIGAARVGRGVAHGFGLRARRRRGFVERRDGVWLRPCRSTSDVSAVAVVWYDAEGGGLVVGTPAAGPLPYSFAYLSIVFCSVCRSVKIASMEERITTGYRPPCSRCGGRNSVVRGALKSISSGGSAGSVGIPVVAAGSMCR